MSAGTQRRRDSRKEYAELDPDARRREVVDLLATGMARAIRGEAVRFSVDCPWFSGPYRADGCLRDSSRVSLNSTDVEPSVSSLASPPVNEVLSSDAGEERATRDVTHG